MYYNDITMKYEFIKHRLAAIGKTQVEFANAIGTTQQKLNVTLNHPELREFQTSEIVRAANFLGYDTESFLRYVADGTTLPTIISDTPNTTKSVSPEIMVDIIDAVTDALAEKNLTLSPNQRKELIKHFCDCGLTNRDTIHHIVSGMLALKSDLFTNGG